MVHPTKQSINYVFDRFCDKHLSTTAKDTCDQIEKVLANMKHVPLFPESNAYQNHLRKTLSMIDSLGKISIIISFIFINP